MASAGIVIEEALLTPKPETQAEASINGYVIGRGGAHSIAIYERNGVSWVAEFRDGKLRFAADGKGWSVDPATPDRVTEGPAPTGGRGRFSGTRYVRRPSDGTGTATWMSTDWTLN